VDVDGTLEMCERDVMEMRRDVQNELYLRLISVRNYAFFGSVCLKIDNGFGVCLEYFRFHSPGPPPFFGGGRREICYGFKL